MGDEILLNRMYSGDYLKAENNIGHEVINLIQEDHGRHYIYVNSSGSYHVKHKGKIKYILLAQLVPGQHAVEVLAKAKVGTEIYNPSLTREQNQILQKGRMKDILYGGVQLDSIFDNNTYHDEPDNSIALWVTFQVEELRRPKSALYIVNNPDPNCSELFQENNSVNVKHGWGQDHKTYYCSEPEDENQTREDYVSLLKMIENDSLWESVDTTKRVAIDEEPIKEEPNFFKIIKKENDELVFSNLFAHFLSTDLNLMNKFASEVLHVEKFSENYLVQREYHNIDILISDEKHCVVIENKIKSGINGIKEDESQLSKYYELITETEKRQNAKFFIFEPNYRNLNIAGLKFADKYTIIKYGDLHKFFCQYSSSSDYYKEFVKGLEKHTRDIDDDTSEEMFRRFNRAVRIIKSSNNIVPPLIQAFEYNIGTAKR